MRVLRVISTLNPRCGGPVSALRATLAPLAARGCETTVACMDDPAALWLAEWPGRVDALGPAIGRHGFSPRLLPWLRREGRAYDAVIAEMVWEYPCIAVARALRGTGTPYFVMAHGGLAPWFRRRYPLKHLKKRLFWAPLLGPALRDAAAVIFSCEQERREAGQWGGPCPWKGATVPIGVPAPVDDPVALRAAFLAQRPALGGRRLLLFLGRLHPVKGCDLLIDAFARVCAPDDRWRLVMAGPDPAGWRPELERRAARLGIEGRLYWTGMLDAAGVAGALCAADALVLPSHHENFGVAAVEALANGIPVLLTQEVGIWREIVGEGAGIAAADTQDGIAALLAHWRDLPEGAAQAMRMAAVRCHRRYWNVDGAAAALMEQLGGSVRAQGAQTRVERTYR